MATWMLFSCCLLMVTSGQTIEVSLGDKAALHCKGSGYGDAFTTEPKSVTWKTQDQIVVEYDATEVRIGPGFEGRVQVDIKKFQEGDFTLTLYPTRYNDGDMYECVWNRGGTDQTFLGSVHLKVLAPPVPAPLSVTVGQSVTLPCYAHIYRQKSQDAISLQWKKGQQDVLQMKSGKVTYGSEQRNRSSVSLDRIRQGDLSLTVQSVRLADEGVYSCSYELNDHPEDGDPARVTVAVTAYTANISLSLGETLHLPLYTEKPARLQFSKAGSGHPVILCSIHNDQAQWNANCSRKAFVQNSTLFLDSITSADEGLYTVQDIQTNRTVVAVSLSVMEGHTESRSWLTLPVTALIVGMVVLLYAF
ncbi:uncharacterized protein [Paramormyrops kingsleyae]|uniref:uncharacterized protein n=1 Tax=Paramormyrops kingsleyae TaxID=1676925 RepID=UPI000CD60864|nr:uncharacterized protein LOC111844462 [Paramormyrops kingsleyae]